MGSEPIISQRQPDLPTKSYTVYRTPTSTAEVNSVIVQRGLGTEALSGLSAKRTGIPKKIWLTGDR